MPNERPEINISKIPIRGGIGALAAIVVLLTVMAVELPAVRWLALSGTLTGLVFGFALIVWRRAHNG
jgi:hypothetical protein